jgi:hypothetical protein
MILALERQGFIRRTPGVPRSIEVLVPPEQLPVCLGNARRTSQNLCAEVLVRQSELSTSLYNIQCCPRHYTMPRFPSGRARRRGFRRFGKDSTRLFGLT